MIYDVARKAGVSRQIVSSMPQPHQDDLPEIRLRIQNFIDVLGCRPNAIYQGLGLQKRNVLKVASKKVISMICQTS